MSANPSTLTNFRHADPEKPAADIRKTGIDPNFWYPIARSKEVKKGKTFGTTFAGEPIVVARTESGEVFALEDRCAHRQVPFAPGCGQGRTPVV